MKYFAKFEKFISHSIIIPSFMTIGSQMPELDRWGDFFAPPYKIGCQNTPYKLGLIIQIMWLKQIFLKKSSRTLILATCYSSIQSYFKIDLILTMLFNVYFPYRKSRTFRVTDKELPKAGQE